MNNPEDYMGYPNMLLPNTESHAITDPLIEDRYYAIVPISQDMTVGSTSNGTVTELMYTSDYTFSKLAGFELGTYEYEEGDIEGPFTIALTIDTNSGGQIVWFSASDFLNNMYNAYSSGANVDLAIFIVAFVEHSQDRLTIPKVRRILFDMPFQSFLDFSIFITSKVGGDVNFGFSSLQVKFSPCSVFSAEQGIFRLQELFQHPVSAGAVGGIRPLDDLAGNLLQHFLAEHRGAKITVEIGGRQHYPVGILRLIGLVVGDQGGQIFQFYLALYEGQ